MPGYKKYFVRTVNLYFPHDGAIIMHDVDGHYITLKPDVRFASSSSNPIDKRLDFSSYFLALVMTLSKRGESFDTIRKICLDITTDYVQPRSKWQAALKRLTPKLINTWIGRILINSFQKRVRTNTNPDGFIANIITDKKETYGLGYGIDILECGICKLFKKHNLEAYASILCEVDEITSGLAGLTLIRTGTIANGASKCDFRFAYKSTTH